MGFSTDAIHVGQEPDPLTGSIVAPIYQTSTYVLEEMGKDKGYDYARTNHPNRKALERTVAKLEGGHAAYVFTSGMAAIDAVFRLLRPGEHTILSQAVYGGVFRLTTKLLVDFGLEFSYVDTSCLKNIEAAIKPNTRMIYVETPTNPTMIVTDLAAVGQICKGRNLTFVVDNTFLSPYLQRPIEFGAHIVVHSMTKYLNGHSDCTGGAAILTRPEDAEKIYFIQRSAGAGLAPMDCFLVSRGVDDACFGAAGDTEADWDYAGAGAVVGGNRGRGRFGFGFGSGAGENLNGIPKKTNIASWAAAR